MARRFVVTAAIWGAFCALANWSVVTSTIGQMAVPWVWLAAWVGHGAPTRRRAISSGAIALIVSTFAYFGTSVAGRVIGSPSGSYRLLLLWLGVSLIVGPISGAAGHAIRESRLAEFAAAGIAAVSMAEPVALWSHIDHLDAHVTYVAVAVVGLLTPFALFRHHVSRAGFVALTAVAGVYPLALALEVVLIALGQVSAPVRLL